MRKIDILDKICNSKSIPNLLIRVKISQHRFSVILENHALTLVIFLCWFKEQS